MDNVNFISHGREIKTGLIRIKWSELIPVGKIFDYDLKDIGIYEYLSVHKNITSIVYIGQTRRSFFSRLYGHFGAFPVATHIRLGVLEYYHPLFPVWTEKDYERCLFETESFLIQRYYPIYNDRFSPSYAKRFNLTVENSKDTYIPIIKSVN